MSDSVDTMQSIQCNVTEFQKPSLGSISTGIGFLDHMLDQLYSHAQIGISIQVLSNCKINDDDEDVTSNRDSIQYHNRNASCDQKELLSAVGDAVGKALYTLIVTKSNEHVTSSDVRRSTFACPLDEALTLCVLEQTPFKSDGNNDHEDQGNHNISGNLVSYTLAPYGDYPKSTGRTHIGSLQTDAIESFWIQLAQTSGLSIQLMKIRGVNAHHIVESSFKAFSRALRNFLDGIDTNDNDNDTALHHMYGPYSNNFLSSINLHRKASIERKTKETSILTEIHLDGGEIGIQISTGIIKLDQLLSEMARAANISLHIHCQGDLWIDEHHTAEDVAISIGQSIHDALGDKAGLNRMWLASTTMVTPNVTHHQINVTMDLSNRPCFTHNLTSLETIESVGDLTCEMFEHVMDSIAVNARMTVHIVEDIHPVVNIETTENGANYKEQMDQEQIVDNVMIGVAKAFGRAFKYCSMVDSRRDGATASSKGTLSA